MSERSAYILLKVFLAGGAVLLACSAVGICRAETPATPPAESTATTNHQPTQAPTTQPTTTQPASAETDRLRSVFEKTRNGPDASTTGLLYQTLAMVAVIGVLGVGAWVLFRRVLPKIKSGGGGRSVRVLETTFVNPRQSVHLLKVGRRRLLVSGGKESLRMLADVSDAFDDESRFSETLRQCDDQLEEVSS